MLIAPVKQKQAQKHLVVLYVAARAGVVDIVVIVVAPDQARPVTRMLQTEQIMPLGLHPRSAKATSLQAAFLGKPKSTSKNFFKLMEGSGVFDSRREFSFFERGDRLAETIQRKINCDPAAIHIYKIYMSLLTRFKLVN